VPGAHVNQPTSGDSRLIRHLLHGWTHVGSKLFNVNGLYHYKSRFRPDFEARYVGIYPRPSLRLLITFVQVAGVLDINWRALSRKILTGLRFTTKKLVP
jgi:phosphatidylglycerol lysyltransferase